MKRQFPLAHTMYFSLTNSPNFTAEMKHTFCKFSSYVAMIVTPIDKDKRIVHKKMNLRLHIKGIMLASLSHNTS